jgi:four helix bundle protein
MQDFRHLETWQVAHALTLDIYGVTEGFPRSELYGLTSQLRRAAVSITANVAEGTGRRTDPGTRYFLEIASGSAGEVDHLLLLAQDLGLLQPSQHAKLEPGVQSVRRLLGGFIRRLRGTKGRRLAPNK